MILATASPYKFSRDVLAALKGAQAVQGLDAFACAEKLEQATGAPVPRQIAALRTMPVRHKAVCEIDEMQETMLREFE